MTAYQLTAECKVNLLKQLGRGAFGIVYHAKLDTTEDGKCKKQNVAVKCLRYVMKTNSSSSDTSDSISVTRRPTIKTVNNKIQKLGLKEISIFEKLGNNHPNIVEYYGHKDDGNSIWIIMELCNLGTLSSYMTKYKPDLQAKLQIMKECAEAIMYMHSLIPPLVHYDIKPSNILLKEENDKHVVKITDFAGSGMLGTKVFMAPELQKKRKHDIYDLFRKSSDIFSLGLLFYVVLSYSADHPHFVPITNKMKEKSFGEEMLNAAEKGLPPPELLDNTNQPPDMITAKIHTAIINMTQYRPNYRMDITDVLTNLYSAESEYRHKHRIETTVESELEAFTDRHSSPMYGISNAESISSDYHSEEEIIFVKEGSQNSDSAKDNSSSSSGLGSKSEFSSDSQVLSQFSSQDDESQDDTSIAPETIGIKRSQFYSYNTHFFRFNSWKEDYPVDEVESFYKVRKQHFPRVMKNLTFEFEFYRKPYYIIVNLIESQHSFILSNYDMLCRIRQEMYEWVTSKDDVTSNLYLVLWKKFQTIKGNSQSELEEEALKTLEGFDIIADITKDLLEYQRYLQFLLQKLRKHPFSDRIILVAYCRMYKACQHCNQLGKACRYVNYALEHLKAAPQNPWALMLCETFAHYYDYLAHTFRILYRGRNKKMSLMFLHTARHMYRIQQEPNENYYYPLLICNINIALIYLNFPIIQTFSIAAADIYNMLSEVVLEDNVNKAERLIKPFCEQKHDLSGYLKIKATFYIFLIECLINLRKAQLYMLKKLYEDAWVCLNLALDYCDQIYETEQHHGSIIAEKELIFIVSELKKFLHQLELVCKLSTDQIQYRISILATGNLTSSEDFDLNSSILKEFEDFDFPRSYDSPDSEVV